MAAAQTAASVKAEVKRLEKQTDQFLSRIVETQNEAVIAAYGDDELAMEQYAMWKRQTHAIARNKQINGRSTLTREEWDRIASDLLPLQVKTYAIVRMAA